MTLKEKLTQLKNAWDSLQTKIKTKLQQQQKSLNETTQKLELTLKENSENESVLTQLLSEFKELEKEL